MCARAGYLGVAWRHIRHLHIWHLFVYYPWYCWRRSSVVRVHRDSGRDGYLQSPSQRNNRVLHFQLGTDLPRIYYRVLDLRGILRVQRVLPRCPGSGGKLVQGQHSIQVEFDQITHTCHEIYWFSCKPGPFYVLRASACVFTIWLTSTVTSNIQCSFCISIMHSCNQPISNKLKFTLTLSSRQAFIRSGYRDAGIARLQLFRPASGQQQQHAQLEI